MSENNETPEFKQPKYAEDGLEFNLKKSFESIFDVKDVTFNEPSKMNEQERLFIEIESVNASMKLGRQVYKATGKATMVGANDKLTVGFFNKQIAKASHGLTKPFFFYDMEQNTKIYMNLVQRSFSFIYFFDSQYDPDTGSITSVELTTEETP